MDVPADFTVEETEAGRAIKLTGDWTASMLGEASERLAEVIGHRDHREHTTLDLMDIGRVDTAGAFKLIGTVGGKIPRDRITARPETVKLVILVAEAMETPPPARRKIWWSFSALIERLGRGLVMVLRDFYESMSFNGRLMVTLGRAILNPRRIRIAPLVSVMERAGLDAVPIVTITNFFIGAVVGLLAANILADFGAQVFAVEGVAIAILREFNIVITAVLLAGRSASSFAAEIGSMKMQQEIDAMQVMGVDPFEALVVPRFLALLILTPLLTFIATIAGLFGGAVMLWMSIDLSPQFFVQRVVEEVGIVHFWVGMSKAPIMAIVVAMIGCRQGLLVAGDVESLGRRVTAAVVHAVFSIIFIDAVFALVYMELDI